MNRVDREEANRQMRDLYNRVRKAREDGQLYDYEELYHRYTASYQLYRDTYGEDFKPYEQETNNLDINFNKKGHKVE